MSFRAESSRKLMRRTWRFRLASVLAAGGCVVAGVTAAPPAAQAYGEPCAPVMLYFSRGSGEGDGIGSVGAALLRSLQAATGVTVQPAANPYPAVAVDGWNYYNAMIGSTAYYDSVESGASFFAHDVTDLATRCPGAAIAAGGWSQGAEVTRYGLARLATDVQQHVKAVALFGDPWFLSTEKNVTPSGGYDATLKGAHYGVSYGLLPKALPIAFAGRSISYCHSGDVVCQYSVGNLAASVATNFSAHMTYGQNTDAAAAYAKPLLGLPAPPPNRTAITSYNQMRGGAPYNGYFATAWQDFVASSNTITQVGVTVGNTALPAGVPVGYSVRIRLCTTSSCSAVLADRTVQIVNFGNTAVDLGDIAVAPGARYYLVWYQPPVAGGRTWVTYWWAGGWGIANSQLMQAIVLGYNR